MITLEIGTEVVFEIRHRNKTQFVDAIITGHCDNDLFNLRTFNGIEYLGVDSSLIKTEFDPDYIGPDYRETPSIDTQIAFIRESIDAAQTDLATWDQECNSRDSEQRAARAALRFMIACYLEIEKNLTKMKGGANG